MPSRLVPLAAGLLLAAFPAPAIAQSGGAAAPDSGGGHVFEQPSPKPAPKAGAPRLRATIFTVTPGTVELGDPLRFTWRVDGPVRTVTARVKLVPEGGGRPISIALGKRRAGTRALRTWTPSEGRVTAGRYAARLYASGPRRARLRRTARASGRLALTVTAPAPPPAPAPTPAPALLSGIFPVQGAYSFGGAAARFGAGRAGHTHQGQDVIAAEGTPVVTPVAGIVFWRAYQAGGAGYYVVIRGDDGRDYAFMHFQEGSTLVAKGQRVAAGQRIASVGNTGDSQGAHLHFEIWPDGWYATKDSHPIDPLPQLLAWAAAP